MDYPDHRSSASGDVYSLYQPSSSRSGYSSLYAQQDGSIQDPLGISLGPSSPSSLHASSVYGDANSTIQQAATRLPRGQSLESALSTQLSHSTPRPPQLQATPRPASIDSPRSARLAVSPAFEPRDLDRFPHGHTPLVTTPETTGRDIQLSPASRGRLSETHATFLLPSIRYDASTSNRIANDPVSDRDDHRTSIANIHQSLSRSSTMSSRGISPNPPPDLKLQVDGNNKSLPQEHASPQETNKRPKSPGLSSFFGWRRGSNQNDSPTTISDGVTASPARSLLRTSQEDEAQGTGMHLAPILDDDEDFFPATSYYDTSSPAMGSAANLSHIDELLKELREVSSELANSIRREMELEDELDRSKTDMPSGPAEHNRRTSDYYSDSGASSLKLVPADSETKLEGLEKMRRKAEQEKAQLRLEISEKAQEDLNQRKALEMHIQSLEEQLEARGLAIGERSVEHQKELTNTQRRLNEEREFKENYEDLLTGMREEIQSYRNERDNLRDEVVPQLRAQLEGLEAQANDVQTLVYENTRLQQENQGLRNENQTLVNARRLQLDMQQQPGSRFRSIAEEENDAPMSPGLSRSNSLARRGSLRNRSGSLTKTRDGQGASDSQGDSKPIEDQRDALQRTLKNLILRQEHMVRNHSKQLRNLESERDKALESTSRRTAFKYGVLHLRDEMTRLRARADEALERKWQCEKGLSGLRMDLERAQQETSSLRVFLQQNDLLDSGRSSPSDGDFESLSASQATLRNVHAAAIEQLEADTLEDPDHSNQAMASELRMRSLLEQTDEQLSANAQLRQRFSEAVERGDQEQQACARRVAAVETALVAAEEQLEQAANVSEDAVASQEEYAKKVRDAADEQSRKGISRAQPAKRSSVASFASKDRISMGPKTPLFGLKSPRVPKNAGDAGVGSPAAGHVELLRGKVRGLEEAATAADRDMQQVIETMSRAKIAVAELQTERDETVKNTRLLQRKVLEEKERAKALAA